MYVECVDVKKAREVMVEYLRNLGWDDVWVRCLKERFGSVV